MDEKSIRNEPSPIQKYHLESMSPYPAGNSEFKRCDHYKLDSVSLIELIIKQDLQINNSQMVLCGSVNPSHYCRLSLTQFLK